MTGTVLLGGNSKWRRRKGAVEGIRRANEGKEANTLMNSWWTLQNKRGEGGKEEEIGMKKEENIEHAVESCLRVVMFLYPTAARGMLGHWATSWNDAGSIPHGIFWDFSFTWSFRPPHYGPVVDSASNRNEYQGSPLMGKDGRSVGKVTFPPSCVDCLQLLRTSTLKKYRGLTRPVQGLLYLSYILPRK